MSLQIGWGFKSPDQAWSCSPSAWILQATYEMQLVLGLQIASLSSNTFLQPAPFIVKAIYYTPFCLSQSKPSPTVDTQTLSGTTHPALRECCSCSNTRLYCQCQLVTWSPITTHPFTWGKGWHRASVPCSLYGRHSREDSFVPKHHLAFRDMHCHWHWFDSEWRGATWSCTASLSRAFTHGDSFRHRTRKQLS